MTRIVLDTCVLVPTVLREILFLAANQRQFEPVLSDRILGEWRRAGLKSNPLDRLEADAAIAQVKTFHADWLFQMPAEQRQYWLPDEGDIHVLAHAVHTHSDGIMTHNTKDFPKNILAEYGLNQINPDDFLCQVSTVCGPEFDQQVLNIIRQAGSKTDERKTFARAWLPKLGRKISKCA